MNHLEIGSLIPYTVRPELRGDHMDKNHTEWIVKETEHGLVKVRQLVRCKDCIHWQGFKGKNSETGECLWMGHDVKQAEGYCDEGE